MKRISTVIAAAFCALTFLVAVFLPVKETGVKGAEGVTVLSLWHVDAFEGGTGSRASYLKRVCSAFEKSQNCIVTVESVTAEGLTERLNGGHTPDLISYSVGCGDFLGVCAEIEKSAGSGGAEIGGKYYAACWAMGGYVVIKRKGKETTRTIISKGKTTHPEIACFYGNVDISGDAEFYSPQRAFEQFASSEDARLIGTQRDIYRLKNKIDDYEITPIGLFTDLLQYVSVTTTTESKLSAAKAFVSYLTGDGQKAVNDLGLLSVKKECNISNNGLIDRLFGVEYQYTLSLAATADAFASADKIVLDDEREGARKVDFLKSTVKLLK